MVLKILIADDDREIVDLLEIYVHNEGYETIKAYDGAQALKAFENNQPDVMILDVMMPEMDGFEVAAKVRETSQVPILMLSAKTSDIDKIKGLTRGADDYVVKPFNPLEVMARVKSLLRRSAYHVERENDANEIEINSLIIRKDRHEVETKEGELIHLTAIEFGILYLLASSPGRVYSAEDIFKSVWEQEMLVPSKTVMVHVSHLRDKLEKVTGQKIVETVWGVGYKVNPD
ncbi:response regulator transcription factor [Allofustis seminis]|uniref:response regulator transcription factor n=1 Tax=Allofustis seminis TaxID=166939 RepID=UPI003CCBF38D